MGNGSTLRSLVAALHKRHGDPFVPPTADPLELILWEQVGYLADDERRAGAFAELKARVGLAAEPVLAAPSERLTEIARIGGSIAAADRAARMQRSARIVVTDWKGDLRQALEQPVAEARRTLKRFPMIGEPGVDKILLLTRTHPVLALDSNGVRVLLRVGYGQEAKGYSTTYRSVQRAIESELRPDYDWLIRAHGLLRRHGQVICKSTKPTCPTCPVEKSCAHAQSRQ